MRSTVHRPLRWLEALSRARARPVPTMRRNWVDGPEALFDRAAELWRANDDLSVGDLMVLRPRAETMYRKTGNQRWAVDDQSDY